MSARIEELRKKFDENPRRYFAPLANEYRKAGDIDQAIAICQEYLPLQPGHMSGHIVLGQALFEAGRLDESRTVFETALGLDPENLIALRHLGDIARDTGDPDAARGWYTRVLEADPRNEEINGLLAGLDELPAAGAYPAASTAEPVVSASAPTPLVNPVIPSPASSEPVIERSHDEALSFSEIPTVEVPRMGAPADEAAEAASFAAMFDSPLESTPAETPVVEFEEVIAHAEMAAEVPSAPASTEGDLLDFVMPSMVEPAREPTTEEMAAASPTERLPDLELGLPGHTVADAERDTRELRAESLEGLEPTTFDEAESAATAATAESIGVTSPMEIDEASERRSRALAGLPALDEAGAEEKPLEAVRTTTSDLPRDSAQLAGLEPTAFAHAAEAQPESAAPERTEEEAPAASAPAFVTETMAELYLRQGHREEAIAVYRQLVAQRPGDVQLRERLAEAEEGAKAPTGPSIRDFLGAIALRRPGEESNGSAPAAAESAPSSSAAPAPEAAATTGGSIDALFGGAPHHEDAAAQRLAAAFVAGTAEEAAIAGAPARPATSELSLDHVFRERGGTPAQGQPTFSFDQFFSQEAGEQGATPSEPGAGKAPDDDIQQFNAWLEGLKKS